MGDTVPQLKASVWWTFRLVVHKPLLAFLSDQPGASSTVQADAIHMLMHAGMCYMFLLLSSMALSMTRPALSVTCFFFVSFAFLTFLYGREIARDLQAAKLDRLQVGANFAHIFMSGMMCWMFLEMIFMAMTMRA